MFVMNAAHGFPYQTAPKAPDDYRFPWYPMEMMWPEAQCLALHNPANDKDVKARRAGATGVHCTGNDFAGLFSQWCTRNWPNCYAAHTFCNTTIKPELLKDFGEALWPSDGKKGNMSAACAWDRRYS